MKLSCGRLRASWHSKLGAEIDRKCTLGKSVRIDRPTCLSLGERGTFEDNVWIKIVADHAKVVIGDYCFLGRGSEFDVSEELTIGHHTLIGPNVFITDHNHNFELGTLIMDQGCASAPVSIGNDVWIGANVVILPGVTIGNGSVVGAGSVVASHIPENSICAGVPARVKSVRKA